jgi:hypothetical protein
MGESRQTRGSLQVRVDYVFDRLHDAKLAQAYSLLVPARERPVGGSVKEFEHEDGSDLRTGVVGAAAGGEHDSEPDGIVDRVRREARSGCPQRVGLRRRGI